MGVARILPVVRGGQAAYYLATGIWPLLHIRSFEAISGPKRDDWLVKTVGAMIAATGASLAVTRKASPESVVLAVGSAAALATVDVYYVSRGTIRPVYLLDAVAEVALAAATVAGAIGVAIEEPGNEKNGRAARVAAV